MPEATPFHHSKPPAGPRAAPARPAQSTPPAPARPRALITGGARRVGRAIVEHLAEAGYDVHFTYRTSKSDATELADACGAAAFRVDLANPAEATAAIADHLGPAPLSLLVNNASLYTPGNLATTTTDQMRELMAVNLEAPLLLCQRLAPNLRAATGGGCVVNLIDLLVERPMPSYLAYCASKAALANATRSLARELAPHVTVNGIAPGVVDWPDNLPQADRDAYLKKVPLARPGSPVDVARLVLFLATQGRYITGEIIRLDGGRGLA